MKFLVHFATLYDLPVDEDDEEAVGLMADYILATTRQAMKLSYASTIENNGLNEQKTKEKVLFFDPTISRVMT